MMIPVSIGEYVDRVSILEIKLRLLKDVEDVRRELEILRGYFKEEYRPYLNNLRSLNQKIWDCVEEQMRKTNERSFDDRYMELARSVINLNNERHRLKREIDDKFGSDFVERKSF